MSKRVKRGRSGRSDEQIETLAQLEFEEQAALLEYAALDTQFSASFSTHVKAFSERMETLENRLEMSIQRREDSLNRLRAAKPGFLEGPKARREWHAAVTARAAKLAKAGERLTSVKQVREKMAVGGERLEDYLLKKLRYEYPELADELSNLQEAERQVKLIQLKKQQAMSLGRGKKLRLGSPR